MTFLFTDVEGSTRLLDRLGADAYAEALATHRRIIREACAAEGGVEVDTQGDAFFFAFPTADGALVAAGAFTQALATGSIQVRVGLHTGTPLLTEEGYVGADVHRAARVAGAGHGGQILVSASTASLISGEGLVDLGEHRFKDLSAPERVYQFGAGDHPALKSLYRTNLPIPGTPFLGRQRELVEVRSLLAREDVRLLTLTGPGGTGKTRLAAQAAGALAERYPDGIWWVPLAPLRDPELVLETASQVLAAEDGLASRIADARMLLLFDNFEHLFEAAVEFAPLLAACPNLELLVTSRQPLQLSGEQEYPVPPFVHEEAVRFFASRARAVVPDLVIDDAVPQICRRLDDLPLALELAAARVKALSPRQILERLEQRLGLLTGGPRDAPERQQTLRAAIEWSYDLLSEQERRLFAKLSVFAGGCTFAAAEQIADADLETLQSLVEKSLLRFSTERYWMLETIREFATEALGSAELATLKPRHANHFLILLESAEADLSGGSGEEAFASLQAERDNIWAALDHLRQAGETETELRFAIAAARFWSQGYVTEGRRRLEDAIAGAPAPSAALRARALHWLASFARLQGDPNAAAEFAEASLELYRAAGDDIGVARTSGLIANVVMTSGDLDRAKVLMEEAAEAFRRLGMKREVSIALDNLGYVAALRGDDLEAQNLYEQSLQLAIENDSDEEATAVRLNLGFGALRRGDFAEAEHWFEQSAEYAVETGNKVTMSYCFEGWGSISAAQAAPRLGTLLLAAAQALRESAGISLDPLEHRTHDNALKSLRAALGQEFDAVWAEGHGMEFNDALAHARSKT